MSAPVIAISSSLKDGEDPYARTARGNYGRAVARAGGSPRYVVGDLERLDGYLAWAQAWVLSGGPDIDPARYGGNRAAPGLDACDEAYDAFELALTRRIVSERLPALFVCRGIQVLNVALGGTLIEDLPSEFGAAATIGHAQHHAAPQIPREQIAPGHVVALEAGTRLAAIVGASSIATNSLHHQALRAVAPQLRVSARTADGVVEAAEIDDHPSLIAVQWHPEALADAPSTALFAALVADARRARAGV